VRVAIISKDYDIRRFIESGKQAEALGFAGFGGGDHVAFGGPMPDILTLLAAVGAVTSRVRLETAVYVPIWRQVVQVASQVGTLDRISDGRVTLGVGVGETEDEFRAFGVPMKGRGQRTNETIEALRRLWTGERVSYAGDHVSLDEVQIQLTPVQEPLPFHVGGRSDAALKRAAELGDGWTGIWCSPRRLAEAKDHIGKWADDAGRFPGAVGIGMQVWTCINDDAELARSTIADDMSTFYGLDFAKFSKYVPSGPADDVADFLAQYVDLGIDFLNIVPIGPDQPTQLERIAAMCRKVGWI
jgi:probable F420-dependent oxidoreductase